MDQRPGDRPADMDPIRAWAGSCREPQLARRLRPSFAHARRPYALLPDQPGVRWWRSRPRPERPDGWPTYPHQENNRIRPGSRPRPEPRRGARRQGDRRPSDANAIFAFDADSGRLLWKTEPIADDVKLSHILGVANGRLVATGDRVLLFNVQTGKLAVTWPDSGKRRGGYRRGLLAGD